jgi:flagellar hook-length control protein FliK
VVAAITIEAESVLPGKPMRSLRLRLNPEELGQLEINLHRDLQGQMTASLKAQDEPARLVLQESLTHLQQSLEAAGIPVAKLEVTIGMSLAHGGQPHRETTAKQQTTPPLSQNSLNAPDEPNTAGQLAGLSHKLLSVRA